MSIPGCACLNESLENSYNYLSLTFAVNHCAIAVLDFGRGMGDRAKIIENIRDGLLVLNIIEEGKAFYNARKEFDPRKLEDYNTYDIFKEGLKEEDFEKDGKLVVRGKLERVLELVEKGEVLKKETEDEIYDFLSRMSDQLAIKADDYIRI